MDFFLLVFVSFIFTFILMWVGFRFICICIFPLSCVFYCIAFCICTCIHAHRNFPLSYLCSSRWVWFQNQDPPKSKENRQWCGRRLWWEKKNHFLSFSNDPSFSSVWYFFSFFTLRGRKRKKIWLFRLIYTTLRRSAMMLMMMMMIDEWLWWWWWNYKGRRW